MKDYTPTAVERLKSFATAGLEQMNLGDLRSYIDAKGFDLDIVEHLGRRRLFGELMKQMVVRNPVLNAELLDQFTPALKISDPAHVAAYTGAHEQNGRIDMALVNSGTFNQARFVGEGAGANFVTNVRVPEEIRATPIAVIGYGAAGVMITFALRELGFTNVTVFEKSKPLGIWAQPNVHDLSRNNPRRLEFYGRILESAPGSGREVKEFLQKLSVATPRTLSATGIKPGNMKHKITFADGSFAEYPIVINAVGLGKPKPISDPKRMTTHTVGHAGIRWQLQLETARAAGQRYVMIGLGNSTAEMLRQIHTLIDRGVGIDYHILTHYPRDAVYNPSNYVHHKDTMYRVFRDVSRPNLVDFQGDLGLSRYDYFRALSAGKIISDVSRWELKDDFVGIWQGKKQSGSLPYNTLMTLIGYKQPEDAMENMGCAYDTDHQCGYFDFDGEIHAQTPAKGKKKSRVHKGYFGFGSVLETPFNPNAIVIPGMMFRIGDVLFGIIMRALEHRKQAIFK